MYSDVHIQRFYYQGVDAVIRVIHRLEDQLEDARAQLISKPESLIALLRKELQSLKRVLAQKSEELIKAVSYASKRRSVKPLLWVLTRPAYVSRDTSAISTSPEPTS